jgi:hypothetical protein
MESTLLRRFGFSYQAAEKIVVRGTYGIYFDVPNYNGVFVNPSGQWWSGWCPAQRLS